MKTPTITEEIESGANGLDGEELTLQLLHENEILRRDNRRAGIMLIMTWLALIAAGIKLSI